MRLLVLAVSLSVAFALDCPKQCDCETGDELEYYCTVGNATVTFKARINDYVNIQCQGTNFTCADLPLINSANGLPLSSVGIKGCSPSLLECLPAVLRTSSVVYVKVEEGAAPLQAQHVVGLGAVHNLWLMAGPEKAIPVSVVNALPSLRNLRITRTKIVLESNVFNNSTPLQFLELSEGEINRIPEDAFNGLSNLHYLNIWGNDISEIGVNSFRGLDSLQRLSLFTNRISSIAAGSLLHVPKLQSIMLLKNQLKELPPGLLCNLTHLENVTIQYNDVSLKLHKHSLSNLPSLRNLVITSTPTDLPEELLTGCDELETINFSENSITSLPAGIFKDLKHLKRLDLSHNKIAALSSQVFSPLQQLTYLNLNRNHLEVLPDFLFSGLRNLNYVSIDENLLTHISPQAFQGATGLKTISLKSNRLTFKSKDEILDGYYNFEEYSPFNMLEELKNLYLNGNQINTMFSDWRVVLTKLKDLNLSGNHFTMLEATDCQFLSDDIVVDLRHNNISFLILNYATVTADDPMYKESSTSILLDDNPLACDCGLYNLAMRLKGAKSASVEAKFVLDNAKCASPPHLKGDLFVNVSPDDLNCDLEAVNCSNSCSTCQVRPAKADLSFDCKTIPPSLPNPEEFGAKSISLRLKTAPNTIENLHLQLLNLSNIGLEEIPFSPSKSVKAIDFSNNKLTKIPMTFLESNITLYLSNNPFECDCWHSKELQALKVSQTVEDVDRINCGDKLLTLMEPLELCNSWHAAAVASGTFIILVISVAIIAAIIYKNSHKILVFIINNGLCPCCFVDDPDDMNKEYDVFVSYAHKDRQFLEKIMPKLENEFGLKTCVHYRDWFVGDFIPDQINRSVEKSRKTIILLSNNFLDSAYANMEFRAAHNLALKEGKNRIILILLEDVAKHEKLSDELKAHMKMNTFLKWEDSRFTEKLQRAMPLRNNKKFVWPEVFKQANEKNVKSGLDVQLNSDGQLVNMAMKDAV